MKTGTSENLNYNLSIDFGLLQKQRDSLIYAINICENKNIEEGLEGILCIIEEIQDQSVDIHGYDEKEVFKISTIDE